MEGEYKPLFSSKVHITGNDIAHLEFINESGPKKMTILPRTESDSTLYADITITNDQKMPRGCTL